MLFILDKLYRDQVMNLHKAQVLPVWQTWRMLNCQPAGGHWTADRHADDDSAGKRCESPLCPWCYLRARVDHATRISELLAQGLPERQVTVSVLRFNVSLPELGTELTDTCIRRFMYRTKNFVRKRSLFESAYRLASLSYIQPKTSGFFRLYQGFVFMGGPVLEPVRYDYEVGGRPQTLYVDCTPAIWLNYAIRRAFLYPIDILAAPVEVVKSYLAGRKGLRTHGIFGPGREKISLPLTKGTTE